MKFSRKLLLIPFLCMPLMASECSQDDATIVKANLIKSADNFEINRRIVFMNTWNDTYLLEIEGRCSMELITGAFNVICKTSPNEYKRHTLVMSSNTTAVVEQLDAVQASAYHYRVTFKPQAILGDVDFRGSMEELTTNSSEANQ